MVQSNFFLLGGLAFLPFLSAFVHPGLLVSDTDIARVKTKLAAKLDPWQSSWDKLISIPLAQAGYTDGATETVIRTSNGQLLWHDAAAAFNLGLRWKIEGDEREYFFPFTGAMLLEE